MINQVFSFGTVLPPDAEIFGEAGYVMQCPVCHDEYMRPCQPFVVAGHDHYDAGWEGKGDLTVLPIEGECGHRFALCFGFHKGALVAFVRINADDFTHVSVYAEGDGYGD